MSQVDTTAEPGWRPDPSGRFDWRYWDGRWTNRVANASAPPDQEAPEPLAARVPRPVTPSPATPTTAVPAAPVPATPPQFAVPAPPIAAPVTDPVTAAAPTDVASRVEPFGADVPSSPVAPAPAAPRRHRRTPWAWFIAFVRSFADQPESYHSDLTGPALAPDPRGKQIVAAPGNYGLAGLVALAACGIAGGAYLPWLSGTIAGIPFHQSGFDLGHGWGYSVGAAALALSALLSVQMRVLRWLTMGLALVLAGFVTRDLMNTYDAMQAMNSSIGVAANVAMGLWIMVISAAIAMIAAVRASEEEKIV